MCQFLRQVTIMVVALAPLSMVGCGESGNRVVTETSDSEFTFDQIAEMTAKEAEEAEKSAENAGR